MTSDLESAHASEQLSKRLSFMGFTAHCTVFNETCTNQLDQKDLNLLYCCDGMQ